MHTLLYARQALIAAGIRTSGGCHHRLLVRRADSQLQVQIRATELRRRSVLSFLFNNGGPPEHHPLQQVWGLQQRTRRWSSSAAGRDVVLDLVISDQWVVADRGGWWWGHLIFVVCEVTALEIWTEVVDPPETAAAVEKDYARLLPFFLTARIGDVPITVYILFLPATYSVLF